MRAILFILLLTTVACTSKVTLTEDEIPEGVYYEKESLVPFTGICNVVSAENGQLLEQFTYKDGLPEGPATFWYANGKIKRSGNFHAGEFSGSWKMVDPDGTTHMIAWQYGEPFSSDPALSR